MNLNGFLDLQKTQKQKSVISFHENISKEFKIDKNIRNIN